MELGGAERSLLGILNVLDYHKYEVDLFLYRHTGELLKYIPKEVNLLPCDKKKTVFYGIGKIPRKEESITI